MAFPLILGIWLGLFSTMVIIIGTIRNTDHMVVHTIADIATTGVVMAIGEAIMAITVVVRTIVLRDIMEVGLIHIRVANILEIIEVATPIAVDAMAADIGQYACSTKDRLKTLVIAAVFDTAVVAVHLLCLSVRQESRN